MGLGTKGRVAAVFAALSLLGGCASTSPEPAFRETSRLVEARSGQRLSWRGRTAEDAEVDKALGRLLAKDLTADAAVSVALLANPSLQETFEDLSIAQADLVQAGLLKNPVLGLGLTGEGSLFASIEQDFLDAAMIPMRRRVAAAQLDAAVLRVGDRVLALSAEVRSAFHEAQAAEQIVALRRLVRDAAEASADLMKRQHEAGTASDLALAAEQALASQARIDLGRSTAAATVARERLTRLLGLWGERTGYRIAPRLPELPAAEVPLEKLESLAIAKRLDVDAARNEVAALQHALSMAETFRWAGFVNVQVEAAKERGERRISFGPSASIELPIFDQKQAAVARLEAERRAAEARLRALAVDARSDVRAARARLVTARALVEEYGKVLVPAREATVALTQERYDAMLGGVYELVLARQSELGTYVEYIESLRDYWIARSDLERAVGTRLSP